MKLELISFKLCPFVQRSVITLLHKDQPFETTFINLMDPPAWFGEISPLGKVPLLRADGEVLFESAVINEFIDEVTPGRLMPEDALTRARHRAWIEIGASCIGAMFQAVSSKDEDGFEAGRQELARLLPHVERAMADEGPFFAGESMSLVDTAYAPLFQRLRFLDQFQTLVDLGKTPKLRDWGDHLMSLAVVQQSLPEDFAGLYPMSLKKMGGYYAGFVD
ncbi:MAG: glutathione S-transferase family protein [Halothiobacillaceae bacterium]